MMPNRGHARTVGELRAALEGLPDLAPIGYKYWPVDLDRTRMVIDPNRRLDGITFDASRDDIDIAPPPEYGKRVSQ